MKQIIIAAFILFSFSSPAIHACEGFNPELMAALEGRLDDKVKSDLRALISDRKLKRIWIRVLFRRCSKEIGGRLYEDTHEEALAKLKSLGMKMAWTNVDETTGTCPRTKIDAVAAVHSVIWVVPYAPIVDRLMARNGKIVF